MRVVYAMQIFVFFPDAAKVGVKDIKVSCAGAAVSASCSALNTCVWAYLFAVKCH
jgi:hypothetical protein